jgi:hypothetical protein
MATAELGITVNTSGVTGAIPDLNNLTKAVQSTDAAVQKMTQSTGQSFQKAANDAESFARRIERALDIKSPADIASRSLGRSADIAAYGAELDRLRTKFNQAHSIMMQYRTSASEIRQAHATGAISINEMSVAMERLRTTTQRQVETERQLRSGRGQGGGAGAGGGGAARAMQANMMYQLQDVAVTAAMGMNPAMIALQQGTQLGMNFAQAGGAKAGLMGMVSGLAGMLSITQLLPIAIVGVGAAMYQWLSGADEEVKDLNTVIKEHEEALNGLREAYGLTALKAEDFYERSRAAAQAVASASALEMEKRRVEEVGRVYTETQEFITPRGTPTQGIFSSTTPDEFKMAAAVQEAIRTGDFPKMERELAAIAGHNDELIKQMNIWINSVDPLRKVNAELEALNKTQKEIIQNFVRPEGKPADPAFIERQRQEAAAAERRLQIEHDRRIDAAKADVAALNARSPVEKARAVHMAEVAKYIEGETELEKTDRIKIASALALARAEKEVADARSSRLQGYDKLVSDAQLELDIIGKTATEQAALRKEYELTYELRKYAAEHGIAVDQKELDLIHEKVEAQRLYTEALNEQKLMQDLLFEQSLLTMAPGEASIARRLRGTGLGMDSPHAGVMRDTAAQTELINFAQSTAKDFLGSFADALTSGGEDMGEALVEAMVGAANRTLDKIIDRLLDDIINTLLFGQGGQGGGSTTGGLVGTLLEAFGLGGGGGAANQNFPAGHGVLAEMLGVGAKSVADTATTSAVSMGSLSQAASAIRMIESGSYAGNYSALGPITRSGDRAYGAYQMMGNNIPSWSKQALGTSMTPQELLGDKASQDAIFKDIFGGYAKKYGLSGAANTWFTGSPKGGGSDILGTSAGGYVGKFNKALAGAPAGGDAVDDMATSATKATEALDKVPKSASSIIEGFTDLEGISGTTANALSELTGGMSELGKTLSSFMSSAGGGGSGWFQGLMGMFGGSGGALDWMTGISPGATASILGAGGGFTGLFHNGNVGTSSRTSRHFGSMAPWADAVRLHGGNMFAADEYPAVLRQGEPVFPSMAAAQATLGGKTIVNVHNYAGADVKTESKKEKSGTTLDVIVDRMVANSLDTRGSASNNALRGKFNVSERMKMR